MVRKYQNKVKGVNEKHSVEGFPADDRDTFDEKKEIFYSTPILVKSCRYLGSDFRPSLING